jgi:hypothetical protein
MDLLVDLHLKLSSNYDIEKKNEIIRSFVDRSMVILDETSKLDHSAITE